MGDENCDYRFFTAKYDFCAQKEGSIINLGPKISEFFYGTPNRKKKTGNKVGELYER
jgi:hypothetical protein